MKKILMVCAVICLALCLAAAASAKTYENEFTKFDLRTSYGSAVLITWREDAAVVDGVGASADGTVVTITAEGTYVLSGSCTNGRLVVSVDKTEKVQLVLNGLALSCTNSAPIYVTEADKVSLTLAEGTANVLSDGVAYDGTLYAKAPNACVCAKADLSINGTGTLTVNGNYNNGIGTSKDLRIAGGTLNVTAVKNALKGNNSVAINDAELTLRAGKDGIKSDEEEKEDKGYIYIAGGVINIVCDDDGMQAVTDITVSGGTLTIDAGGKTINCPGTLDILAGAVNGV